LIQRQLTLSAEALRSFVKVNQLLPEYAAPWLDTAEIHFEQKRFLEAGQALQQFSDLARPMAKSLWLSVRLEKYFGNRDAVASQGLKLKKLFPYSSENREYQQWLQR
jgi:type IV pilus assembly protein PilF